MYIVKHQVLYKQLSKGEIVAPYFSFARCAYMEAKTSFMIFLN